MISRLSSRIMPLLAKVQSRLQSGSFAGNVMVMFMGTAGGQLVTIALSPVLTRLYGPHDFGVLSALSAILNIACVVACLRYEMALPLARKGSELVNLLAVCLLTLVCIMLLSGAVLLLLPLGQWLMNDNVQAFWPYRWLLLPGFAIIGLYQIMVAYATAQGNFRIISRTKVYQGFSGPLTQIGLALLGSGTWGLVAGFIVGQSTGAGALFRHLVNIKRDLMQVSWAEMKSAARRFISFPLLSSWSGLMNAAGSSTLILALLPFLYSSTVAGYVFLTDRVIGRPLLLITTSILQVFIGDVSNSLAQADPAAVRRRFLNLFAFQLVIVGGWLLVINLLAGFMFPLVFGQAWAAAVPLLHILSIAYLFEMTMHPMIHTLQILERQALALVWEGGRFVLVLGALLGSFWMGATAEQALLAYSLAQAVAQVAFFALVFVSINRLQPRLAEK